MLLFLCCFLSNSFFIFNFFLGYVFLVLFKIDMFFLCGVRWLVFLSLFSAFFFLVVLLYVIFLSSSVRCYPFCLLLTLVVPKLGCLGVG